MKQSENTYSTLWERGMQRTEEFYSSLYAKGFRLLRNFDSVASTFQSGTIESSFAVLNDRLRVARDYRDNGFDVFIGDRAFSDDGSETRNKVAMLIRKRV